MIPNNQSGLIGVGFCLAVGIALGGYFIGQTMYNAKVATNTAEAKGLAEQRVEANQANWTLVFRVTGNKRGDMSGLYKKAETHQDAIIQVLKKSGFDEGEIEIGVIDYFHREYRDANQTVVDQKHELVGSISVETDKVKLVSKVRAGVNKLMAQGLDIENKAPRYVFTKLNDIKPELLREATHNARLAANEFAENAGVEVGGIRRARQGNFYIRDAGENSGDSRKVEKDVRVVTTITFYLTD